MTDVKSVNPQKDSVTFTDGTTITHDDFVESFKEYFHKRIAGETLMPLNMERFMKRGSAKNLKQLVDGKKHEGFMEGASTQMLSPKAKWSLIGIATAFIVVMIALMIARNMGLLPF